MVDINLFKEDEDKEKEKKEEEESVPKEGEDIEDELGDDFLFDEESSKSESLDDELFDEEIPDLEEIEERGEAEDYDFGETKKKKTSVGVWIALAIVVIGTGIYMFVLQPREQKSVKKSAPKVIRPPLHGVVSAGKERPDSAVSSKKVKEIMRSSNSGIPGSTPIFSNASIRVLKDLSESNQFGAIVLMKDRFFVEYVSETPNVSKSMGHRISTLLNATNRKVSPEERHRTGGKIYYWGVVSGKLPQSLGTSSAATPQRFASADDFIRAVKTVFVQNGLQVYGLQKLYENSEKRESYIRVQARGTKENTLKFLGRLNSFRGNFVLSKLTIAPVLISDFQAKRVKVVLDFIVNY